MTSIFAPDENLLGAVTTEADAPSIGLAVDGDAEHGGFMSAVLGWNLGDDDNAAQTVAALGKILGHFGVEAAAKPLKPANRLIYTSAVRDSGLGHATWRSRPSSSAGRAGHAAAVLPSARPRVVLLGGDEAGRRAPGPGSVSSRRGAVTPDGVDYFIKAGSVRSPYGGKRLFHSIAVAMPMVEKPLPPKG